MGQGRAAFYLCMGQGGAGQEENFSGRDGGCGARAKICRAGRGQVGAKRCVNGNFIAKHYANLDQNLDENQL